MFSFIVHVFISLFAVSNPIGNVPIFLTLTEGYTAAERKAIARKAAILSFFILAQACSNAGRNRRKRNK